MSLVSNAYGKEAVRVVRVTRDGDRHSVSELRVGVRLQGDFARSYLRGDNSNTVPTDTIKNIVYGMAKKHEVDPIEEFGCRVAAHFVERYAQVSAAEVEVVQTRWERMRLERDGGRAHDYAFTKQGPETRRARVTLARGGRPQVRSMIHGLTVLKTHGSSFEGFPKCEFTTLPEAKDRLLCTTVRAEWTYNASDGVDYNRVHEGVRQTVLDIFANQSHKSVQETVHVFGTTVLERFPHVESAYFQLPNIHVFKYDIGRFGLANDDEVFYPVDEPHGNIEGTVTRVRSRM